MVEDETYLPEKDSVGPHSDAPGEASTKSEDPIESLVATACTVEPDTLSIHSRWTSLRLAILSARAHEPSRRLAELAVSPAAFPFSTVVNVYT